MTLFKLCRLTAVTLVAVSTYSFAGENFDSDKEAQILQNIQQLTFSLMGFEKVGDPISHLMTKQLSLRLYQKGRSIINFIPCN